MIQGLLDETTLQLYTLCTVKADSAPKRGDLGAQTSCKPYTVVESVASVLQGYG